MPPSSRPLLVLHGLSLVFSLVLVGLTAFDIGVLSYWCNPFFGVATVSFHLAVLLLSCTRPGTSKYTTLTASIIIYVLSFGWLAAFFAMIAVYRNQAEGVHCIVVCGCQFNFPPSPRHIQRLQFMIIPVIWILLCDLGIRTTVYRYDLQHNLLEDDVSGTLEAPGSPTATQASNFANV